MSSHYFLQLEYLYNPDLKFVRDNWKGNPTCDLEFMNGLFKDRFPIDRLLKWSFSNQVKKEGKKSSYRIGFQKNEEILSKSNDVILWLGHSSFFIRIGDTTIITDPCFGNLPFHSRLVPLPFDLGDLEKVDYVLISHGHRDHFDEKSIVSILKNSPETKFLVPLQMGELLQNFGISNYQEAGWFQQYSTKRELEIIFTPAKHWHRRDINDYNRVLWGSFLINYNGKSIFFAGDTAYGSHFSEIKSLTSSIDICLMPIGAYKPSYLRQSSHMNPHESVHAFNELGGKTFIPMHYGTYKIGGEPMGEPQLALTSLNISGKINGILKFLKVGEEYELTKS
jgi:L-ascorbate metabolism protein UlaG (beta-lactamase superfamily)